MPIRKTERRGFSISENNDTAETEVVGSAAGDSHTLAFSRINQLGTALTVITILLGIVTYSLRMFWEGNVQYDGRSSAESISVEVSRRCFSLAQIKLATHDFSEAFVIGQGGFGKVYKGLIPGFPNVVAMKRLDSSSRQGAVEFQAEIETLSKLHHIHLVSLIGYCKEGKEMILVYEYIPGGTLADNIYRNARKGMACPSFTWEQRLRICIGATRGLDYLHTSSEFGVIHRDVKDTNILLDHNFVAKISDFGLSKLEQTTKSKSFWLCRSSLFYSKQADEKKRCVLFWHCDAGSFVRETCFRECMENGDASKIIDPRLQGNEGKIVEKVNFEKQADQNPVPTIKGESSRFSERVGKSVLAWPWKAVWNRGKQSSSKINTGKDDSKLASNLLQVEHLKHGFLAANCKNVTYDELRTITNNFRQDGMLGEGRLAKVYKGFLPGYPRTGLHPIPVAIKVLSEDPVQGCKEWQDKAIFLGRLLHPNLVKLVGYCCEDEHRVLIHEYIAGGSVDKYLFSWFLPPLSWSARMKIAFGAAKGLAFLHHGLDSAVIFCVFRTSYILLELDCNVKLTNFGMENDGPVGDTQGICRAVVSQPVAVTCIAMGWFSSF